MTISFLLVVLHVGLQIWPDIVLQLWFFMSDTLKLLSEVSRKSWNLNMPECYSGKAI